MTNKAHWDSTYEQRGSANVSWFRQHLDLSFELIRKAAPSPDAAIIDVGGGASTLVDDLLGSNYHDVTVLDLSAAALAVAKTRLGPAGIATAWQQRFVPAQRWRLLRAIEVLTTYRWLNRTFSTTWMARPEYAACYSLTCTGTALSRNLLQKKAGASRAVRVARSVRCSLWRLLNNRNCDDIRRQVKARMRQALRSEHQQVPRHKLTDWFADHLVRAVVQVQAHAAIGVTDEERRQLFISRPSGKPIALSGS